MTPLKFLILTLLLVSFSCKKETPTEGPMLGKRDYVWSIDSVDYGSRPSTIQLKSIWASSPVDVWGVNGDAPDVRDCLWHYDGVNWARATEGTPITEFTGNKTVYAVCGSSHSDVWAAGRKIHNDTLSAFLMHFDGVRWVDATPTNVGDLATHLYGIHGIGGNDIWCYGYEYAIHFDGGSWVPTKVADSMIVGSLTSNQFGTYLQLYSPWGGSKAYICKLTGGNFIRIDSTNVNQPKFGGEIWILNSELYSIGRGVISTTVFSDGDIDIAGWRYTLNTSTYFSNRFVQNPQNIFAVGQFNLIYHFNGGDWKRVFIDIPNQLVSSMALFRGVWSDGVEVFICDTNEGLIYHGR